MSHLFHSTNRGDVVTLSTPPISAVVLSPVKHVPQVLTSTEVLMLKCHPSTQEHITVKMQNISEWA